MAMVRCPNCGQTVSDETGRCPVCNTSFLQSAPFDPTQCKYYSSMVVHVLLLIFTLGIWYLIWIYRMTECMNQDRRNPKRTPVYQLLLCMFVPFYSIYWVYKTAESLDNISQDAGQPSDMAVICLILAIFISIIPPILIQDKINHMIETGMMKGDPTPDMTSGADNQTPQPAYTAPGQSAATAVSNRQESVRPGTPVDLNRMTDSLKRYRELYDLDILSDDEFTAKKREQIDFIIKNTGRVPGLHADSVLRDYKVLADEGILTEEDFAEIKDALIKYI